MSGEADGKQISFILFNGYIIFAQNRLVIRWKVMFDIVKILAISLTIGGSEHMIKSSRRGDLKVPNYLPLIFKSCRELLVVARFVRDLRFMNVCQRSCLPELQFRSLQQEFLLARRLWENFPLLLLVLRCFLVWWIRGLLNHLYIAIGVEMTTSDNVSITYTIGLHVVTLVLNIPSNIKQKILYDMECRNWNPELGAEIVNFKLFVCSPPWWIRGSICSIIGSVMFVSPTTDGGLIHSW